MSIEKMGGGSPKEKEPKANEFKIVYPDGGEALMELNPDEINEVVYMEGGPNTTKAQLFSSEEIIKGTVDHDKGVISWEDGTETEGQAETDIVFAKGKKGELSERRIIQNIMIGSIDKEAKIITFE